jgi:hypothetical protein
VGAVAAAGTSRGSSGGSSGSREQAGRLERRGLGGQSGRAGRSGQSKHDAGRCGGVFWVGVRVRCEAGMVLYPRTQWPLALAAVTVYRCGAATLRCCCFCVLMSLSQPFVGNWPLTLAPPAPPAPSTPVARAGAASHAGGGRGRAHVIARKGHGARCKEAEGKRRSTAIGGAVYVWARGRALRPHGAGAWRAHGAGRVGLVWSGNRSTNRATQARTRSHGDARSARNQQPEGVVNDAPQC